LVRAGDRSLLVEPIRAVLDMDDAVGLLKCGCLSEHYRENGGCPKECPPVDVSHLLPLVVESVLPAWSSQHSSAQVRRELPWKPLPSVS
jgi:hypothetical protein